MGADRRSSSPTTVLLGHRVEYVGDGWPARRGQRGLVVSVQQFASVYVEFEDGVSAQYVTTYPGRVERDLRVLPVKRMATLERRVAVVKIGGGDG